MTNSGQRVQLAYQLLYREKKNANYCHFSKLHSRCSHVKRKRRERASFGSILQQQYGQIENEVLILTRQQLTLIKVD